MILRRYGSSVQSVETNFDPRALTEIGFRRDHGFSMPAEEFDRTYEKVEERALAGAVEGDVHDEAEASLLDEVKGKLDAFLGELGEDEVLLVESEAGQDYPKTRSRQSTVTRAGENRLHFQVTLDPPLRVGRYRRGA